MSAMLPCPFCGGGETRIDENRLRRAPTMDGKESPIVSVEIRHWCPPQHGQPSRNHIVKVGRDMDAAIAAWNRRSTPAEVEALRAERVATVAKLNGWGFTKGPQEMDAALITRALDELMRDRRMLLADKTTLRARVERLEASLRECANDLEAYVMREYSGDVLTPGNALRRARDLAPVDAARAALEDRNDDQ